MTEGMQAKSGRIFLANVGANASHGFAGPIFPNGTFEFLPIPEDREISGQHAVRYMDLESYNEPGGDLLQFVPRRLWGRPAHNDPEFRSFTYGDNCSRSPRASALRQLRADDFLLFLARLEYWVNGSPTGRFGFFLVGFIHIQEILDEVKTRPDEPEMRRFGSNAHVRRGLCDPLLWDGFWVFRGSRDSRRFRRAVPVTKELAARVFTAADGSSWQWDRGRTDLQVIGSYTRSCRCILDPAIPGQGDRAGALWDWVREHAG